MSMMSTTDELVGYGLEVLRAEWVRECGYPGSDDAARLTDEELVRALWAAANGVPGDRLRHEMFVFVGKALERWAPAVEWAERVRERAEEGDDGSELEAERESRDRRRALRAERRTQ